MAKKKIRKVEEPGEGKFAAGEFEEPKLPVEVPPSEEEFEELEIETAAWGVKPSIDALISAKEKLEQKLLVSVTEQVLSAESGTDYYGFENIVGVGISEKMIDEQYTGEPCIAVYVVAKAPKEAIDEAALVPEQVDNIPTDVVVTGELHAFPHRGRYRPAPGGVSVGHYRITAGTLGCLVKQGRALYILSNNHVLANCNSAKPRDPILQPGPYDGGHVPQDVIAILTKFIPIKFNGLVNHVDCAIAQTSPRLVTPLNKCFGRISSSPVGCRLNLIVKKCGRTTQFTRGRIVDCNATIRVGYGTPGWALFQNQILIVSLAKAPFSAPGDSGSLIVTDVGNRPVGLLFAGSSSHTIANPIGLVLSALNVTIVS